MFQISRKKTHGILCKNNTLIIRLKLIIIENNPKKQNLIDFPCYIRLKCHEIIDHNQCKFKKID